MKRRALPLGIVVMALAAAVVLLWRSHTRAPTPSLVERRAQRIPTSPQDVSAGAGSVRVRVVGAGRPVSGAPVTLARTNDRFATELLRSVIADERGEAVVTRVPAGEYVVCASGDEWEPACQSAVHVDAADESARDRDVRLTLRRGGAWLEGRVLERDGGFIEGATVMAVQTRGPGAVLATSTTSGAEGRYRVRVAAGPLDLEGSREGYLRRRERVWASPHDLFLAPASSVAGRVVDKRTGDPVGAAQVWLRAGDRGAAIAERLETTADALGGFQLRGVPPGKYELLGRAEGLFGGDVAVDVSVEAPAHDVVLSLEPGVSISGRAVAEPDGKPVPTGVVQWMGVPEHPVEATLRADGTFRIDGVPQGNATLVLRAPGYRELRRRVVASSTPTKLELRLERAPLVSGIVLDSEGRPVEGAVVTADVAGSDGRAGEIATSDVRGRFTLVKMLAGRVTVTATHARAGAADVSQELPRAGERPIELPPLRLRPGAVVEGTVRDASGKAVAGVAVSAFPGAGAPSAITAEDGRYRIEPLRTGRWTIVARRTTGTIDDREERSRRDVELQQGETRTGVDLVVPVAGGRVEGVVVDPSGHPVAGARLTLRQQGESRRTVGAAAAGHAVSSDAAGRFRFDDVPNGAHVIQADDEDHGTATATDVTRGQQVRIVLTPAAVLTGRVRDQQGQPVSRYRLLVTPSTSGGGSAVVTRRNLDVLDADGKFEVRGAPAGRVKIEVAAADGRSAQAELSVGAGERPPMLELVVGTARAVTGSVVAFDGGAPLAGIAVRLSGGAAAASTVTGADGRFRLEGVPTGRIRLVYDGQGFGFVCDDLSTTVDDHTASVNVGVMRLVRDDGAAQAWRPGRVDLGVTFAVNDRGPEVAAVRGGSPAARAGIAAGDLVRAIDGRAVAGVGPGGLRQLTTGTAGAAVHLTLADRVVSVTRELREEVAVSPARTQSVNQKEHAR